MTASRTQRSVPEEPLPPGGEVVEQLRRIVRLLESAEVLMQRARRTRDTAQAAVLRRRAARRRTDAEQVRAQLPDGQLMFRRLSAARQTLSTG
jgi:hypothetical protein